MQVVNGGHMPEDLFVWCDVAQKYAGGVSVTYVYVH